MGEEPIFVVVQQLGAAQTSDFAALIAFGAALSALNFYTTMYCLFFGGGVNGNNQAKKEVEGTQHKTLSTEHVVVSEHISIDTKVQVSFRRLEIKAIPDKTNKQIKGILSEKKKKLLSSLKINCRNLLTQHSQLLPAEATRWPSNHAVHRKGEEQKGLSHPLHRSLLVCFWCEKGAVLAAAPSPLLCVLTSIPPVWFGGQESRPEAVSEQFPPAGPRGRAGMTGKGKSAGAPACARAAASNRLCKAPEA
ncbi:hypothetical protein EK904_009927 [Melospiza melodia maxima]|nr:hypothetical protein EK904_009927 [Melospiza melodia maxima]